MSSVRYTTSSLHAKCLEGLNTEASPEGRATEKGLKLFLHKAFNVDIDGMTAFIMLSSLVLVILSTIHGISPNAADDMRYAALGAGGGALVLNKPLTWIHYNFVTLSQEKVQKLMKDLRSNMTFRKHFAIDYPKWVSDGVTPQSDFNPIFAAIRLKTREIDATNQPQTQPLLQQVQDVR